MKFDPASFKAPVIRYSEIRKQADRFRSLHWHGMALPINILEIVEFNLKLDIVPLKGLQRVGDVETFLFGNCKAIAVDEDKYMDDRQINRINFSVAHEVGHLVLHKDLYTQFDHHSEREWIDLVQKIPQEEYNWLEWQAHEFAGRLLVPVDELRKFLLKFEKQIKTIKSLGLEISNLDVAEHIAPNFNNKFRVSAQVIARRINSEKLL